LTLWLQDAWSGGTHARKQGGSLRWQGFMAGRSFIQKRRRIITWVFAVALGVLVAVSASRSDEYGIVGDLLFLAGLVFVGVATVGRLWCSLYIAGYKTDMLITTGPYSVCRNPLYFFSLIGGIGLGLATETVTIAVIIAAGFLLLYPFVIRSEEKGLRERHGANYDKYMRDTPRFFPSFKLFREPEEYTVRTRAFRRRVWDSMCFIWIVGGLELIEALHEHHILPVLFRLY
jgi:protein-S-isoprenylcysteine O-methyltransferase Ste14